MAFEKWFENRRKGENASNRMFSFHNAFFYMTFQNHTLAIFNLSSNALNTGKSSLKIFFSRKEL